MPSFLENLIIFALVLNVVAFALYGLSLRNKRMKAYKVQSGVQQTKEKAVVPNTKEEKEIRNTIDEGQLDKLVDELKEIKNESENKKNIDNNPSNQLVEEVKEIKNESENQKNIDDHQLNQLVEELKQIDNEPEIEIYEPKKEKEEPKPYEVEFVQEIKAEIEEVDKLSEPFELIEGMDEESKFKEEEKEEVTYSIGNEAKETPKEVVKGEKLEAKREIMDSVNILEVEGDEEPEDIDDEFVVRHYEPFVYQNNNDEEQDEVEENQEDKEKKDEDEIEKRIAYLTGEWTENYVIQPKKGRDSKK